MFNEPNNHCPLKTAFILIFVCVDSQKGDIMRNNNVDNNLCVRIKKNALSEIPSYE